MANHVSTTMGVCADCGSELSAGGMFGHCPKCLIVLGLSSNLPDSPFLSNSPAQRRLGDYELTSQIGRGGMGAVYRARQISLNREVALKMILPGSEAPAEAIRRFQIEAEAAANLHHPNIVPIYAIGQEEGEYYFSMQYIEGGSLKDCFSRFALPGQSLLKNRTEARAAQVKIARLLQKIADAVGFAHQREVLHRDIKPQNILMGPDDEPILADFGLVKILDANITEETRFVVGTLNYMSPEMAAARRLTPGADVFSLGVMLYELLTGRLPFAGATPADTYRLLADQDPVRPKLLNKWIDSDLQVICLKCLQKKPEERYATAANLAADLNSWLRNEPIRAKPISRLVRMDRWVRRNRAVTALLVGLASSLTVLLVFLIMLQEQVGIAKKLQETHAYGMATFLAEKSNPGDYDEIDSEVLSVFSDNGDRVVYGDHFRLTVGVPIHLDHLATTRQYSKLLYYLENAMEDELGKPVRLNLRLYRAQNLTFDNLISNKTDFVLINPLVYMQAELHGQTLQPIAEPINSTIRCVIVANKNSNITNLAGVRNRFVHFGEENSPISFWAKAILAKNGVMAQDLAGLQFLVPEGPTPGEYVSGGYLSNESDPLRRIMREAEYEVAVAREQQIEHFQKGLNVLAKFPCIANSWVAAGKASPEQVRAFRSAMTNLRDPAVLTSLPDRPLVAEGFKSPAPQLNQELIDLYEAVQKFHGFSPFEYSTSNSARLKGTRPRSYEN